MSPDISVLVDCAEWSGVGDPGALAERAIEASVRISGIKVAADAEVSVLFCDDAAIRELNRTWRHKDKATNVLSFPAGGAHAGRILGDIAIAFETTRREAGAEDKSFANHTTHLIIHGFLHLNGYDHETDAEAEAMEQCERKILASLGIADPYCETKSARLPTS